MKKKTVLEFKLTILIYCRTRGEYCVYNILYGYFVILIELCLLRVKYYPFFQILVFLCFVFYYVWLYYPFSPPTILHSPHSSGINESALNFCGIQNILSVFDAAWARSNHSEMSLLGFAFINGSAIYMPFLTIKVNFQMCRFFVSISFNVRFRICKHYTGE